MTMSRYAGDETLEAKAACVRVVTLPHWVPIRGHVSVANDDVGLSMTRRSAGREMRAAKAACVGR